MTRWMTTLALGLLVCVSVSVAEESAQDPGMEAMKATSFLVGRWEGDGWMQRGPGEPHSFRSLERVESRLDGRVLIIEGIHHARDTEEVVHHALATISYNPTDGSYRFRSHLADGTSDEHTAKLEDGAFVWGFETPRGQVRFTIRIKDDEWHEIGEFSPDGESWSTFFQMDLKKADG